jgi:hypothetical protein
MNVKLRKIEIDAETAAALELRAAAQGISVSKLVADLVSAEGSLPPDLESMRAQGRGPWAPEMLAEDARQFADFERGREGVPWEEVKKWMQSWGSPNQLPAPKPRKL